MVRITIVGAGNLAWAFTGDLWLRFGESCRVTLWAPPTHRTNFDRVAAIVHLELTGAIRGKFFPTLETDLSKAIPLADFIVVAVPTFGQVDVLTAMTPFNLGASIIIALPDVHTRGETYLAPRVKPQGNTRDHHLSLCLPPDRESSVDLRFEESSSNRSFPATRRSHKSGD